MDSDGAAGPGTDDRDDYGAARRGCRPRLQVLADSEEPTVSDKKCRKGSAVPVHNEQVYHRGTHQNHVTGSIYPLSRIT
jgi:hypothetical protein